MIKLKMNIELDKAVDKRSRSSKSRCIEDLFWKG